MIRPDWPRPTTAAEESELGLAIRTGGLVALPARNLLAQAHIPFALSRAQLLAPGLGMEVGDAFGAGQVGLIEAAGRFDPARGCRYTTYARWYVDREIRLHAAKSAGSIAVSSHLFGQPGRNPELTARATAIRAPFVRLDAATPRGTSRHELIPSPGPSPDHPRAHDLRRALARLHRRDREVVERAFGLAGGEEETVAAIARRLGISATRAGEIKRRAMERLGAEMRRAGA